MYLSVIVPAYNEEKRLYQTIKSFDKYLSQQSYVYEIIIVNDGSTDGTKEIAEKLMLKIGSLRLLDNKANKGKGAAVRQGLLEARGEHRLFIDADNATSIDHLSKVWPYFDEGYNIVIGSRNPKDAEGACQVLPQSFWKRFLGVCGNLIIRKLAVKNIWDTQCGFKVFTKKAIEDIMLKTITNRWAIDVEILALAQVLDYKIAAIPVYWINAPDSKVGVKGYFLTLKEVFKIRLNLKNKKYKTTAN